MKLIDNIKTNHYESIHTMLKSADGMILASPFLTEDFDEFIYNMAVSGVKHITLITTIRDNSLDLFKKANSFYSFCKSCVQNSIKFEVRIDNKLHGKIYIAINNNIPIRGIITSANFTENGLIYNHEWGIETDDTEILKKILFDLTNVCTSPLTDMEITAIITSIDDFLKEHPTTQEQNFKLEVTKHIKDKLKIILPKIPNINKIDFPDDTRFFLKPVGSSEHPFDESRNLNETNQIIHFSKRKPSAVRPNDILICYGVGTTKLLGYFRVTSEPFNISLENARWPWVVNSDNLCPKYSAIWSSFNNRLSSVIESYGNEKVLTYVGGKSLGALNFGADKIRLNESLAHYIINIIEQAVKQ